MIIGIVVQHNTGDNNNKTITKGAYFLGLHNHPAAMGGGWGCQQRLPEQDEQTSSENLAAAPQVLGERVGQEAGRPFLSFLFFLICLRSNFTF